VLRGQGWGWPTLGWGKGVCVMRHGGLCTVSQIYAQFHRFAACEHLSNAREVLGPAPRCCWVRMVMGEGGSFKDGRWGGDWVIKSLESNQFTLDTPKGNREP
jgi:hypothetical protein